MTELDKLLDKLRKVEALYARTMYAGERDAAGLAMEAIRKRLKDMETTDPPREYKFSMGDEWSRRLFVALLRRYGLTPYRYYRQRYTTVMVRVPAKFVDETLWPEFQELDKALGAYLAEVTDKVIAEGISSESGDVEVREEGNRHLPPPK